MQDEVADAGVQRHRAPRFVGDRRETQIHRARKEVVRQVGRDAGVGRVDDAADGARAVEEGRRAPDDLDLVGREGVDRDGVVGARRRDVAHPDAVLEHADPIAALSPDDRPRRAPPKNVEADAGLSGERLADRRLKFLVEVRLVEDVDRLRHLAEGSDLEVGGDRDLFVKRDVEGAASQVGRRRRPPAGSPCRNGGCPPRGGSCPAGFRRIETCRRRRWSSAASIP